ncbi:unnamed protein product [Ectocarpus sp. CCAP 1310/34]|nr:unnamed protein product [Ectocarpus sp. CCAP 1310/34]
MARQSKETMIKAGPVDNWKQLFPLTAKALGVATVAAGVIATSVPGLNVGMSICTAICEAFIEWTSRNSVFKASDEVTNKMNNALQATLALEDERIANAQYCTSPAYIESVETYSAGLRGLLDLQSKRMKKEMAKTSTTQRYKDEMMEDMLGEVLDRQARRGDECVQEREDIVPAVRVLVFTTRVHQGGCKWRPICIDCRRFYERRR